jgi:hypothetical protein
MRLLHSLLQIYHAKRALRHALLSRWHVEQGEAHLRRAQDMARRTA